LLPLGTPFWIPACGGLRAPTIGGTCAFDAKNRVFFGWSKFVNAYVERDKKNFSFLDFWLKPLAQMIDLLPLTPRAQAAGADGDIDT